jgi:hypothetical protein
MTRLGRFGAVALPASMFFFALASAAQQKIQSVTQENRAYDVSRETALQGTVVSYSAASSTAPLGPHVIMQTSSGLVDVHLGNAKLLEVNHFALSSGDNIHVLGENVSMGTSMQFVARAIQKGEQSLILRSLRGFPLLPTLKRAGKSANSQAGVP